MQDNDAVTVAPEIHTVVLANDLLRVLRVVLAPKQKAAMHWHPKNILYTIHGGSMHIDRVDGSSVDVQLQSGVAQENTEGEHAVENSGVSTIECVQIEFLH